MKKHNVYAILLAGGKGTRLWPISSADCSKPFASIGGARPLIKSSIEGLRGLIDKKHIIVVVDAPGEKLVKSLVREIPGRNILTEPFGKSTASAVGLAAIGLKAKDIMVVLPTDVLIKNAGAFKHALKSAINFVRAEGDVLLCLGVRPGGPSAAYGYIKTRPSGKNAIYLVEKFIEKPNEKKALEFIKKKNYLWNAGIFIFETGSILNAFKKHSPLLYGELMRIKKDKTKKEAAYRRMKNVSIDYQIMQKAKNLFCAKGAFSWYDLGNWRSAGELFKKDKCRNAVYGKVALIGTRDSIIYNSTKEKLGVVGIKDAIVVRTENGTLVSAKKDAEKIRELTGKD